MHRKHLLLATAACAVVMILVGAGVSAQGASLTPTEQLGKLIFFDDNLSINGNQSCATCHDPDAGWTGPNGAINTHGSVYEGSIPGAFGDRKPPSSAYATQSPILSVNRKGLFVGGNFWDGRATGETLGSPAAEQAQGPFLNPVEQALPSAVEVVSRICASDYGNLFREVWGSNSCTDTGAYDYVAFSIAAYEASPEVNAFTSKFDYSRKGQAKLTRLEQQGWTLFKGKGKCAKCHIAAGQKPLFTDYTFDNLGLPQNPENPAGVAPAFVDSGLGHFLAGRPDYAAYAAENMGKHKVPTVRNVAKGSCESESDNPDCIVKAYGHNGYFKSLADIVHFYNTRDVEPWPPPEVEDNINTAELGNLGLTEEEEAAIVAFLMALSDGYGPGPTTD